MTATPEDHGLNRPLPELELEVMKVLWRKEKATVGEVQEDLKPRRPLAYTTVMTVMDRLARKRAVTRAKKGRGYLYQPAVSRTAAQEVALDRLLHDFFGDSPRRLASYLQYGQSIPQADAHGASVQLDSSLL